MVKATLVVALGGALGSSARFLLSHLVQQMAGHGFPYGTLAVNLLGSFLIAIFHQLGDAELMSVQTRLLLTTGVMGGFTTYSTFNYDTLAALNRGAVGMAGANVIVTLVACLVGGAAGLVVGRWMTA